MHWNSIRSVFNSNLLTHSFPVVSFASFSAQVSSILLFLTLFLSLCLFTFNLQLSTIYNKVSNFNSMAAYTPFGYLYFHLLLLSAYDYYKLAFVKSNINWPNIIMSHHCLLDTFFLFKRVIDFYYFLYSSFYFVYWDSYFHPQLFYALKKTFFGGIFMALML